MNSVRFGSITKIVLKNWPGESAYDRATEKQAIQQFNRAVADFMDAKQQQHANDPTYKVRAYAWRPDMYVNDTLPRVLVLDNEGQPDLDNFVREVANEEDRVIAMAYDQSVQFRRIKPDELASDTTTPLPRALDLNKALERLFGHRETLKNIAITNILRKYGPLAGQPTVVDAGLPDVKNPIFTDNYDN